MPGLLALCTEHHVCHHAKPAHQAVEHQKHNNQKDTSQDIRWPTQILVKQGEPAHEHKKDDAQDRYIDQGARKHIVQLPVSQGPKGEHGDRRYRQELGHHRTNQPAGTSPT